MVGARAHPDGYVAGLEYADAMCASDADNIEAPARFREDSLAFLYRKGLVALVLEPVYCPAILVIPHPTLEGRKRAAGRIGEHARQLFGLQRNA